MWCVVETSEEGVHVALLEEEPRMCLVRDAGAALPGGNACIGVAGLRGFVCNSNVLYAVVDCAEIVQMFVETLRAGATEGVAASPPRHTHTHRHTRSRRGNEVWGWTRRGQAGSLAGNLAGKL